MKLNNDQERRAMELDLYLSYYDEDSMCVRINAAARELIYLRDEVEYLRALVKAYDESTNRRQLIAKGDGYVMLKEPPA